MLPIFRDTVKLLRESIPKLLPVIHVAPNQYVENYTDGAVQGWPMPVILIPGGKTQLKYDAFSVSPFSSLYLCIVISRRRRVVYLRCPLHLVWKIIIIFCFQLVVFLFSC